MPTLTIFVENLINLETCVMRFLQLLYPKCKHIKVYGGNYGWVSYLQKKSYDLFMRFYLWLYKISKIKLWRIAPVMKSLIPKHTVRGRTFTWNWFLRVFSSKNRLNSPTNLKMCNSSFRLKLFEKKFWTLKRSLKLVERYSKRV